MRVMDNSNKVVLALYPNRYGVAYALFRSSSELIEYGTGSVHPVSNKLSIKKVRKYIDYYRPDVIITRNINDLKRRKSQRIDKLINLICTEARKQQLDIYSYTRTQIKETFKQFKATSKYLISQKLISWFRELKDYEFPMRKRWMNENYNAGIFDAISLAITHWYLDN